MDGAEKDGGAFVSAGGEGAVLFEAGNKVPDQVAAISHAGDQPWGRTVRREHFYSRSMIDTEGEEASRDCPSSK